MTVSQSTLRRFAFSAPVQRAAMVRVAKAAKKQTAFLCHSHLDTELAKGVQGFLQAEGWEVYIDWEDTAMPDKPDRETARQIQAKIGDLDWLLFLATGNSMRSRWCPWELGYADGVKPYESILIIPTTDQSGVFHGNEYLQLYQHISPAKGGGYGAFYPNGQGRHLRRL